ncbi:MAG TPA: TlpA disulfide reductase family protein [Candidatus Acidoferrum sp.]
MSKTVLVVIAALAAIVLAVHFADKATRLPAQVSAKVPATAVSAPAPDVTLKSLDDKNVSIADYKGKIVLVNFWATWCDPCRAEIPELIEMQEKYGPKGFTVLGVAMDEEGKKIVDPFVHKEHFDVKGKPSLMNYPILIGTDDAANKFGGLFGYPTSVLIGRDGKQIKRITGQINAEEISKAIESQL